METVLGTETLYAATSESLELDIACTVDPTDDPPQFALSAEKAPAPAGSFIAGVWSSTWGETTPTVARAVTPLIGGASDLLIVSGQKYSLWVKTTAGDETPAWIVGTIICP